MTLDTNFDNVQDVEVYNEERKMNDEKLDELLSVDLNENIWKEIQKLAVMQVRFGLAEAMKSGLYADQVVKTAMALMKQAGKTFDADAAAELSEHLTAFRDASKKRLKEHKEKAINASMN